MLAYGPNGKQNEKTKLPDKIALNIVHSYKN